MQRLAMLMMALTLVGCQSTTTDRNEKPKECDVRAADSGLCVPGGYENE
jgi:putative hemolysin